MAIDPKRVGEIIAQWGKNAESKTAGIIEKMTAKGGKVMTKEAIKDNLVRQEAKGVLARNGRFTGSLKNVEKVGTTSSGYTDLFGLIDKNGTARAGETFKAAGRNIAHSFTSDGGGFWKNYGGKMVTGAAIGAGTNGALEWGQGGSFWEGAKSGAVTGAFIGAGYGLTKAAVGLPNGKMGQVGSRVSKQVQAMFRNGDAVEAARSVMRNR
ncbi:MAG TPA: hypothetical protein VK190_03290 [Pseudoneobacillus sp.]|jgi:hypothetical protein|nr:hypothetical protein [Pseudoneobacillus sp.]